MANKTPKSGGSAGGVLGVLALVGTVVSLVNPVVDIIEDKLERRAEEKKDWVRVPEICSKRFPVKLDVGIEALKKSSVRYTCCAVNIKNADIKYKDCFDMQIVDMNHKDNEIVNPGTVVIVSYVTSEIIEASQRLFEESEKRRAEVLLKKADKRAEQKEKSKQVMDNVVSTVQQTAMGAAAKVKSLKPTRGVKNPSEEDVI